MNLQQLTYFHKIAERKNYTKASQELSVSQSNLSHSMSKLEEELGVPLFVKNGRNIEVTVHGKKFDQFLLVCHIQPSSLPIYEDSPARMPKACLKNHSCKV